MPSAFLIIQTGAPYKSGDTITITKQLNIIGRETLTNFPDIAFRNAYISRSHAALQNNGNTYTIKDLGSKHGTFVNNIVLATHKEFLIKNNDQISLGNNEAVMRFKTSLDTACSDNSDTLPRLDKGDILTVNIERRQIFLNDTQLILFGKDLDLLLFLYEKKNCAVSYEEIKTKVWPERITSFNHKTLDVGTEEVNSLIYRLRKKLGSFGHLVVTVPKFGYMLDLVKLA